jgi:tRNA threonylcarbamoyladenosine modification (KEOPS) complex  Pcc1 subunit
MEYKATLEIPFKEAGTAKKARDSLIQETEFTKKSRTKIKVEDSRLVISISAGDFASLRATLNSYARLLAVFFGAKEAIS